MLKRPRSLGPRPEAEPGHARDLEEIKAWSQQQCRAFDRVDPVWRELHREFSNEDINDVIASKGGFTTVDEIRKTLKRQQGNGHPLYDIRRDR